MHKLLSKVILLLFILVFVFFQRRNQSNIMNTFIDERNLDEFLRLGNLHNDYVIH